MEGKETAGEILLRGTKDLIGKALDKGPTTDFLNRFHDELGWFLDRSCSGMSAQATTTTTEHEGPFGILPPPAKRQVAKEILAGLPISPLKTVEETVTEAPERTVDQLTFHAVAEVNPLAVVNPQEIMDSVNILQALKRELQVNQAQKADKSWRYKNNERPAIRLQRAKGVLYLIQRNVTGNYSLNTFSLDYPADVQRAIEAYRESLSGVFTVAPGDKPKDDFIAHEVIYAQIKSAIGKDGSRKRLSLPIILYPKIYKNLPATYSLTRPVENNKPFMFMDKNHDLMLVEHQCNEETQRWQIVSVDEDYGIPVDFN